jgi:hypothetical protein
LSSVFSTDTRHGHGFLMSPSSRGPGHWPFTPATGVRIPLGTPKESGAGTEKVPALGFFQGIPGQSPRHPGVPPGRQGFESPWGRQSMKTRGYGSSATPRFFLGEVIPGIQPWTLSLRICPSAADGAEFQFLPAHGTSSPSTCQTPGHKVREPLTTRCFSGSRYPALQHYLSAPADHLPSKRFVLSGKSSNRYESCLPRIHWLRMPMMAITNRIWMSPPKV